MNWRKFFIVPVMYVVLGCHLLAVANAAPQPAAPLAAPQPGAPLASLSLITEPSGVVDLPVGIAGHSENLRLATGSMMSMLTESVATELGLPRDHVPYHELIWAAGARVTQYAIAESLRFDHFDASGTKFLVVRDAGVPFGIAGQLGDDYLRKYDIEFDFLKEKLNVYAPGQCSKVWSGAASAELPMEVTGRGQITVDVQLDGKPTTALLDTGLLRSVLSLDAGKDMFGFSEKTPGLDALATHSGMAYLLSYPFKTIVLQGVSIADPDIEIQTRMRQWPNLILGASVLRRMDFCISYDAGKLYVNASGPH